MWRFVKWVLISVIAIIVLYFGISYVFEYRPDTQKIVFESDMPTPLRDTLRILIWNVGYAGLGDDMDYFYDGGQRVRTNPERAAQNWAHISSVITDIDADITMLQEVDFSSHRSYGVDMVADLQSLLPDQTHVFSYNYNVLWVPIPLRDPIGNVQSGVVTISKQKPIRAIRLQYPSEFPLPERMFNLKRGLLSTLFLTSGGDTVAINNTHNSAFDDGQMRETENTFLVDYLKELFNSGIRSITGGDWNQFPPSYVPTEAEVSNPYFTPRAISDTLFDANWTFVYDSDRPSMRFLDRPMAQQPTQSITDFFFVSPNLEIIDVETIDTKFMFSDHTPIVLRVVL